MNRIGNSRKTSVNKRDKKNMCKENRRTLVVYILENKKPTSIHLHSLTFGVFIAYNINVSNNQYIIYRERETNWKK